MTKQGKVKTTTGIGAGIALIVEGFQQPGVNWTIVGAGAAMVLYSILTRG